MNQRSFTRTFYTITLILILWSQKIMAWDPNNFKKLTDADLKKKLNSQQYQCTQQDGTERPFQNEYWNNHREGIYVDVVSGEPLFSSTDKYDSGSGWPSFTQPIKKENVVTREDHSLLMTRTEIRSKHG